MGRKFGVGNFGASIWLPHFPRQIQGLPALSSNPFVLGMIHVLFVVPFFHQICHRQIAQAPSFPLIAVRHSCHCSIAAAWQPLCAPDVPTQQRLALPKVPRPPVRTEFDLPQVRDAEARPTSRPPLAGRGHTAGPCGTAREARGLGMPQVRRPCLCCAFCLPQVRRPEATGRRRAGGRRIGRGCAGARGPCGWEGGGLGVSGLR